MSLQRLDEIQRKAEWRISPHYCNKNLIVNIQIGSMFMDFMEFKEYDDSKRKEYLREEKLNDLFEIQVYDGKYAIGEMSGCRIIIDPHKKWNDLSVKNDKGEIVVDLSDEFGLSDNGLI